ncbi:hypothetical protein [Alkaliphilus hydrothermalis]|uniref:Chaperonin GroEL (HSP60 family) n=1 Tax=Alkaliphilus hydrothermalis TaxID=1482730 RepID=A0ABS2NSW6_9FIRM|nr:hypothetical protein [Alkaliphilus hydrothermalis]MBM7616038.1 chaperonin GroEL (HSP60 family) [Alkaliphilus hydrothermalis]
MIQNEESVRQIAHNAGLEGSVIVEKVIGSEVGVGFDALIKKYGKNFRKIKGL